MNQSGNYPWFVKRDLDGFFGLFIDNLVQLLVIIQLCTFMCGMGAESDGANLLYKTILPGAAISILFGNLLYAWQAHRLAGATGRSDVTALPYGINTPSLLVFVFFVMAPAYAASKDPVYAWKMGLIACLGSGIIELLGSFVAGSIRKSTPRAALLSTLAGIAIGFISMKFAIEIFEKPLLSMVPLAIVLVALFSKVQMPLGLPGGFLAIVAGSALGWLMTVLKTYWVECPEWLIVGAMDPSKIQSGIAQAGLCYPKFAGDILWKELNIMYQDPKQLMSMLTVIIPMGIFNVIGSMQNIESAEAAGDKYWTFPSMAINGVGTILAALFGSCFPTTIYIGHPGWKALGSRAAYSSLNGIVITAICFTGVVGVIQAIIPIEAGNAIVLWIGIVITAQAFQATPKRHAPAVAFGLFPAIAAWGSTIMQGSFFKGAGTTIQELLAKGVEADVNGFLIKGLISIEQGYILTCMLLSALVACLIDRKFISAAVWSVLGGICAMLGITHAFQVQGNVVSGLFVGAKPADGGLGFPAYQIALGYFLMTFIFLILRTDKLSSEGLEEETENVKRKLSPSFKDIPPEVHI